MEYVDRDELMACLSCFPDSAGNPGLMTTELMQTLCDHACGNYRMLCTMVAELLYVSTKQELMQLEEKLYLTVFQQPKSRKRKSAYDRLKDN